MQLKLLILTLFCAINMTAFTQYTSKLVADLKAGDLLFVSDQSTGLSEAIDGVTKSDGGGNFMHMGMLVSKNDSLVVIHSNPEKGVHEESVSSFVRSYPLVSLFRFQNVPDSILNQIQHNLNQYLGEKYNVTYIMEDPGMYCSELIYEASKDFKLFGLNEMTFKSPGSSEFHEAWVKHYEKLGIPIPEGKLGCNPNKMSTNERLQFLGHIKNPN